MDLHQATISIAVLDSAGKLVMESIIETKAATILQFIHGLRGNLHVTFEEGTSAAWLCDLLAPHVTKLVVCNPRKNASLKEGNKNDRVDARKLVELMLLTQGRASNLQHLAIERLGRCVVAHRLVQLRQVVQAGGKEGMGFSQVSAGQITNLSGRSYRLLIPILPQELDDLLV